MLEPWIIEQIRRREEEERRRQDERPRLELPVAEESWDEPPKHGGEEKDKRDRDRDKDRDKDRGRDEPERGVVIIGF